MYWINFKDLLDINGFSKLFIDYLYDFQKVKKYYEWDYQNTDHYKLRMEDILKKYTLRNELYEILLEQNKNFDCGEKTFLNISKFKDENTFAVVTGQQLGILGGPLYTFYKLVSLIKLVNKLNVLYPEYNFIPIFWLEAEDHDFEEVNKIHIITAENQVKKIEYLLKNKSLPQSAISDYRFDNIDEFITHVETSLPHTDFKNEIINFIRSTYKNGDSFGESFVKFYNKIFNGDGIVFINSNDKKIKNILKPLFKKEIQSYPKTCRLIIDISAKLEEEYHNQIKPKPINLFMFYRNARHLIEIKGDGFGLRGTRKILTQAELDEIIENTPELLSPNVVLRPVCQDYLLPTVAYIAGPSEIAYFAQLKPVYNEFGIQMPIIYPRASITIIEEKTARILEKYELDVKLIIKDTKNITQQVLNMISEIKIDPLFTECMTRINDNLNELKFGLDFIDHTLLGSLETTRQKIIQHLNLLKEKTHLAQQQKHEIALRQVEKAVNNILPNGDMQERELNLINYMNKYGFDIYKKFIEEIEIDKFQHQIIELP